MVGNSVITSIEILSPVNKREPGLTAYQRKRLQLHNAGVHLLELDLLRGEPAHFIIPGYQTFLILYADAIVIKFG